MKNRALIIILMIIIALTFFSYGILVGNYSFFPFEQLKEFKILVSIEDEIPKDQVLPLVDIESIIEIENNNDVEIKKVSLRNYIWKNSEYGNSNISLDESVIDNRYSHLDNLKQIDKISTIMEYDVDSKSYLFLADKSNNKLIIYHQGHDGDFYLGINTIEFFLKNNYNVLAFSMPLHGMNDQPIVNIPRIGKIQLFLHQQLQLLDNEKFSSIKFFLEPIYTSLNLIDKKYTFDEYIMLGISGGCWTSTIYAAIDERVSKSFSVAGGLPISLRNNFQDKGDYEQILPEMYRLVNYPEIYILASIGDNRKHVQIFNVYDTCCYAGEKHKMYNKIIKSKINELGEGYFESYSDITHKDHQISQFALDVILEEINS